MPYFVVTRSKLDAMSADGTDEPRMPKNRGHEVRDDIFPNGGFVVKTLAEAKRCTCSRPGWDYKEVEDLSQVPIMGGGTLADEKDRIDAEEEATEQDLGAPLDDGDERGVGLEINHNWKKHSDTSDPAPSLSEMSYDQIRSAAEMIRDTGKAPDIDLRAKRDTLEEYVSEHSDVVGQ